MSLPLLKHREPVMAQDILTEAIPARSYTEGSALNLARAALFGVPPSKVESIVELLKSYRGGKPNSLIMGGPMGWSWHATLDTTHHGSLAGPADAHRHSDLANIGIDNHHARDHADRHHSGGADALALGSVAGNLTDAQHGSRTVANAHAHSHLSGIGANDHHNRSHDHSLAADGSPIVVAGVPNLDVAKITTGRFGMARMPSGTSGQVLTAQGAGVDPAYSVVPAPPAVAGDNLVLSADTERYTENITWTKLKEIKLGRSGEYRIKFEAKGVGFARVYRNGSAVGIEQTLTDTYQTFSEDIGNWSAGDLCQIYARKT